MNFLSKILNVVDDIRKLVNRDYMAPVLAVNQDWYITIRKSEIRKVKVMVISDSIIGVTELVRYRQDEAFANNGKVDFYYIDDITWIERAV